MPGPFGQGGLVPTPLLAANPNLYAQMLSLSRQQALANALMSQGVQNNPNEYSQEVGPAAYPHVVPYGIGRGLEKAGNAIAGAELEKGLIGKQAELGSEYLRTLATLANGGAGISGQPPVRAVSPSVESPDIASVNPFKAVSADVAASESSPQITNSAAASPRSGGSFGRGLAEPNMMRIWATGSLFGPQAASVLAQRYELTPQQKLIADAESGNPDAQKLLTKAEVVPPVRGYAGGYFMDPVTHKITQLPNVPRGMYAIDPSDPSRGVALLPNVLGQERKLAQANSGGEAAGRAPYHVIMVRLNGKEQPMVQLPSGALVPADTSGLGGTNAPQATPLPPQVERGMAPTQAAALKAVQDAVARGHQATYYVGTGPQQQPGSPWASVPKAAPITGYGMTPGQERGQTQRADFAAELSKKYGALAADSNTRKAFNDQALSVLPHADVGPGSSFIAGMKAWLTRLPYVKESDFQNTPSAYQALNKDLANAALQRGRQLFGSRFTQSEVGIMLGKAAPSTAHMRAAIRFLLESDNAQLGYQIGQDRGLGRYLAMGGDPYQFEGWYAKHFPMSQAVEQVPLQIPGEAAPVAGGAASPGQYNAQQIVNELRKRGIKVQ